jgi:hypothetical protein
MSIGHRRFPEAKGPDRSRVTSIVQELDKVEHLKSLTEHEGWAYLEEELLLKELAAMRQLASGPTDTDTIMFNRATAQLCKYLRDLPSRMLIERDTLQAELVEETAEAQEDTPEEEDEPPEETPEPLILGRYKSTDDLVNAYQEVRGLQQRTAGQIQEKDAELEEMKALLAQAAQALQAQQGPQQPDPQLVQWAENQGIDPASLPVLMQLADQAAAAKVAPMQQQLEAAKAEQEAQAAYNAQVGAIQQFRQKHPEVAPNSDEDNRHAEVFKQMQDDPQIQMQWNEDTLEIALEASRDPDLYAIIRANPALIDTDEGLEYARWQATLKKGTQTAQTQALKKQTKAERTAAARKAHVETGSVAPGSSPEPEDAVDIAFALPKNDKTILW